MEQRYKVMGINDDESYCSCCGKTGLKRVVWLAPIDPDGGVCGEAAPYGTTCAAYNLRITKDKGSRATARIERAIEEKLIDSINAKIADIRKDFKQLPTAQGTFLVPPDASYAAPLNEILADRDKRYPILGYLNGKLTIKQAAQYL